MVQHKRREVISGQESETCTPEESLIVDRKQVDSDDDGLSSEDDASQEGLDPDEFSKKWDDISYLMHKQFRCK
ncbi:MAG TPA: hypothetical protein VKM55_16290 [Candidatus Lokiarchaeia archaeon]|nr:hypothetical protein [Candidatus Lokiarchaeia archaeon]